MTKKCFEDFAQGFEFNYTIPGVSVEEIVQFAEQYDPQRFHLDEAEASNTHFGGLVASGFQTQLLCFKPFCEAVLQNSNAVGAPGIDNLKWLRPWYPNEPLEVVVTLVDKRPSSKRSDRGYLSFHMEAAANAVPTLSMDWMVIILTREGAAG